MIIIIEYGLDQTKTTTTTKSIEEVTNIKPKKKHYSDFDSGYVKIEHNKKQRIN